MIILVSCKVSDLILPLYRLIIYPVTISWMQSGDMRLLGQRQRISLSTAPQAA